VTGPGRSEPVQRIAHAGLRLCAEPLKGGPEQGGKETGRAFDGELGSIGHLGAAVDTAEAHGVDGDDRLVLPAELDALGRDELTHDVCQLGLPAEDRGGVQVGSADPSVAMLVHGRRGARVPLRRRGEIGEVANTVSSGLSTTTVFCSLMVSLGSLVLGVLGVLPFSV
jgi:hypothetical protein